MRETSGKMRNGRLARARATMALLVPAVLLAAFSISRPADAATASRFHEKPDRALSGAISGELVTNERLEHVVAFERRRGTSYAGRVVGRGGGGGRGKRGWRGTVEHLPSGRYDLLLGTRKAVAEGLSLLPPGAAAAELPEAERAEIARLIQGSEEFFNRKRLLALGSAGTEARVLVELVRDKKILRQSGAVMRGLMIRRLQIATVRKGGRLWQIAETKHLYREEVAKSDYPVLLRHARLGGLSGIRVVRKTRDIGAVVLPAGEAPVVTALPAVGRKIRSSTPKKAAVPRELLARGPAKANLVVNGSFERGTNAPEGWTLRFSGPGEGHYQGNERHVSLSTDAGDGARALQFSIPKKVAEVQGVKVMSKFARARPGQAYLCSLDVRSTGTAVKVFVEGWTDDGGKPGVKPYRAYVTCSGADRQWRTFQRLFQPPERLAVRWLRVELYAYYPPGEVRFDNVVLRELTADEDERWRASGGGERGSDKAIGRIRRATPKPKPKPKASAAPKGGAP